MCLPNINYQLMLLISSCHWLTEMCENNAKWSNGIGIKFSRMPYEKHDYYYLSIKR